MGIESEASPGKLDKQVDEFVDEEESSIQIQNKAHAKNLQVLLQQESDHYVSLGEGVGDFSDGLSNLTTQPVSGDFITGIHVFSALLALYGFIRAIVTFNKQELSLSTTARLLYIAGTLILLTLAYLSPLAVAMALTVTLAALAFTESIIRLGKFIHMAYSVWERSKTYDLEEQALEEARLSDIEKLSALDLARDDAAPELQTIEQASRVREEAFIRLTKNRMSLAQDKAKLTRVAFFRAYSMLIVSVSLTAAILAYFFPVVAGGLAIVAFGLGAFWLGYAMVTYLKHLIYDKSSVTPHANKVSNAPTETLTLSPNKTPQVEAEQTMAILKKESKDHEVPSNEEIEIHDPSALLGGSPKTRDEPSSKAVEPSPRVLHQAQASTEPVVAQEKKEDEEEGEGEREGPHP